KNLLLSHSIYHFSDELTGILPLLHNASVKRGWKTLTSSESFPRSQSLGRISHLPRPKGVALQDYGEVPAYLQRRSEARWRSQEEHARLEKEREEQEAMQQLTEEERQAALQHLKKKWDALHEEYQRLPLIIETLSKKAFKKSLEDAMNQLDKDICLLEKFPIIYITKN
uniref:Enkurin domain-containing protein n=1 Tax=Oryzias sinensis TaxID=183150 RepID=A0A8C7WVD2_9TELE